MLTLLSRLFYYESAAGRKLDSARASGTNTLGKLKKASQTTRRALLGDRRIANDDPHRKATACPGSRAHARELSLYTAALSRGRARRIRRRFTPSTHHTPLAAAAL